MYIYGKEGIKSDYTFLLTENRGALHAEPPTPAHIPEISLEYKKVWIYSYSYKKTCYQTYFKLPLIFLCIIFVQFCTNHQKGTKMYC